MANETKKRIANIFTELADAIETGQFGDKPRIALTLPGSEHGSQELVKGAEIAVEKYPNIDVVLLGSGVETDLELIDCKTLAEAHDRMDEMLTNGDVAGAVTLHYSFPIGVSTVGKVITPAVGKEMLLSTTTGTSATKRVASMVKNAAYGLAVARALGEKKPSLGILNIEGARLVEQKLLQLDENGYSINFAESARKDGGAVMRGNDLLLGTPDIMVTDTLTGNMLMKMFSAFTTGGGYEASGYGYGPGVGENFDKLICIISRASGAPVIANAMKFAADAARGDLKGKIAQELKKARKAGLDKILNELEDKKKNKDTKDNIIAPPVKTVTEEIPGIDILNMDEAKNSLWQEDIYAETGMGCTGPVILVAEEDVDRAREILRVGNYISKTGSGGTC
ncbi:glycine/sarcosine/betaine reductase complex component C subunit alpha [Halocella sp. SP3-1]|uniref:glycine/sarcosine/betaine reductase complex component C subunit alpha n=1 Tax=Halocella sp. SP3-1 TaxID=2382161 RepID=UPI000F76096B|nr:glycine/sarcosine/betaine reductase complex component C subunit alpha [Halocella sp. SP3-1]AZO94741.1 glycine reductase [Halocella sp. SP3-1]